MSYANGGVGQEGHTCIACASSDRTQNTGSKTKLLRLSDGNSDTLLNIYGGQGWWGGLALAGEGTAELNLHPSASDGSSRPNPVSLVFPQDPRLGS